METKVPAAEMHRVLNLQDLVLLNIACIVGLSSLAEVAQFGFGSMALYALAIMLFLVPSRLAVAELSARIPAEGESARGNRLQTQRPGPSDQ